jgi:hypothetical protein
MSDLKIPEASLIPLEHINALEVFTEQGMDTLLAEIEEEVSKFKPDLSTVKSRGEIKSMAYKVTLCKGVVERARVELVKEWKQKAKDVDGLGRKARDFLNDLSTKVRQKLTDYEAETAAMQAEAENKAMLLKRHDEALAEHDIWLRERDLSAKEFKLEVEEEERQRVHLEEIKKQAQEDQLRQAKEAEDARISAAAKNARLEAEVEAQRKIQAERERANEAERQAEEAAKKAKRDKDAAIEAERLRMIREQAEKDAAEKILADATARAEAKRQANADHRRQVNQGALQALIDNGFNQVAAKKIITVIFQGKIPGIRMMY